MAAETKQRVLVTVDPDHMKAWLRLAPDEEAADVSASEVAAALEAAKVAVDDPVVARIRQFIKQVAGKNLQPEPFLVAKGILPVGGEHGKFIRDKSIRREEEADEDAQIDYRAANMIFTVEKGAVIGKVIPPVAGKPGVDVHGNPIRPKNRCEPIKLQANVRLAEDGQTVIAEVAGRVVAGAGKLSINDVLEITGDVDFESGNVDATSDVSIRGTVRDLFEVVSKKTITIGGAVEAAKVQAGEDVLVRGGILPRGKGVVRAEGCIVAKFCNEAYLYAGGGIEIAKEAINSHLHTLGELASERAAIIGGEVYARQGVQVHTIGSDACVPTRVLVGLHPRVVRRARDLEVELKKRQDSVERIRHAVSPLLANLKRLSPAQKERATELMYQADELERSIKDRLAEQEAIEAAGRPSSPPCVQVQSRICQNVVIGIDDREVHFQKELKGPIRIEKRKIKNVTEIVAANTLTGSITVLSSKEIDLDAIPDEEQDPFEAAKAADESARGS